MASFPKPYKDIASLLGLLQSRGLQISDAAKATRCLERIGYYRLSGYWYPMRQSSLDPNGAVIVDQAFRAGADFCHAADLYVFDKRLRILILDAIERIEVGLKVKIAQILGQRDPLAYLNPSELHGNFSRKSKKGATEHEEWIQSYRRNEKRSKEDFINPFLKNHAGFEFPIWMAIEFWDFGNLSFFLPGMKVQDRISLASSFNIPREELLTSWVKSIHSVRNTCAHHSRLWNRPLVNNPKPPKAGDRPDLDHLAADQHAQTRLYAIIAAIQFIMKSMHPGSDWSNRLKGIVQTFPNGPNLDLKAGAGFPVNWETLALWN
ncbi:Abi family protein [Sphingomonas sp. 37zxx]|uniref:Abi family protein n=1 Tax=Sphingomonas sp. 37zxx TaxID=1550073 RepID=UPI0009DD8905|nr:Abi family protein [Sphingomonas sp. 37zxx]